MSDDHFIDATKLTLEEWLDIVFKPPKDKYFMHRSFPTNELRDEYIASIQLRSDEEVQSLLSKFLVQSTSFGLYDELAYKNLVMTLKEKKDSTDVFKHTYFRRLAYHFKIDKKVYPWEGNTWVIDLLPDFPKAALEVLDAYLIVHMLLLPDAVLQGLWDAQEIIRAKYIGLPKTQADKVKMLLDFPPRYLENLAERLYKSMGYETEITQPSRDGGRDVIAKRKDGANRDFLLIECKRFAGSVNVRIIRELHGVVSSEKANHGVLITTGRFTNDSKKYAQENSIRLIDGDTFVRMLNEYIGTNWPHKVNLIVGESEKHYREEKKHAKPKIKGRRK